MDLIERGISGSMRRHPWELARLFAIGGLVERAGLERPRVLDVGCGDGYLLKALSSRFSFCEAVGFDINLSAPLCKELAAPSVHFVSELSKGQGRFDLILLLDVVEHVREPEPFLTDLIATHLAPGGMAIVTAPAFQSLFSEHDRQLLHYRRYGREQLDSEVAAAGLVVLGSGYFFMSLLAPRWLSLALERRRAGAEPPESEVGEIGVGAWTHGAGFTALVAMILRLDIAICLGAQRFGIYLGGLSVWSVCKKR